MTPDTPYFSVVIPSRNRPDLLRKAIDSVAAQSFRDHEIILVNDGSDEECEPALSALQDEYGLRRIDLRRYPRGHGPSYAINSGVWEARGRYCAFLDDDDVWTDTEHLSRAHAAILRYPEADAYFSNQLAVPADDGEASVLWLGGLESRLEALGVQYDEGIYKVSVEHLMSISGFCHLNTTIVRRSLYQQIGGMDEDIRWEGDRDFYLRLIDAAGSILFNPRVVSRHHVPDSSKAKNVTTATSTYQRHNYQLCVLNKATLMAQHPLIRAHGRQHKTYVLKRIVETLVSEGRYREAAFYAREAMLMDGSWRWPLYTLALSLRGLFAGNPPRTGREAGG